jgi:hypothetical protein
LFPPSRARPFILQNALNAQRAEYSANLKSVRARFAKLEKEIPEKRRVPFILRAIDNVQQDIRALS